MFVNTNLLVFCQIITVLACQFDGTSILWVVFDGT